jgi:hypothetical protein
MTLSRLELCPVRERFRTDLWLGKNGVWVGAALPGRSLAFSPLQQERELRRRKAISNSSSFQTIFHEHLNLRPEAKTMQ